MPSYLTPGVYVEEKKPAIQPIEGVSTSVAAFIGVAIKGPVNKATLITSLAEFVSVFGGAIPIVSGQERYLYYAVRHFFGEGGTKCYVVRVTGYDDIDNGDTIQAISAFKEFDAETTDGTTVSKALKVSALTPGRWGETLKVQVENASKFSVLLAESITGSSTLSQFTLKDNQDVQVGSVLYLTEQVTGQIKRVNISDSSITFTPLLTAESARFDYTIPKDARVFSPDMKFESETDLTASINVKTTDPEVTVKLKSLLKLNEAGDTFPLKAGDLINISINFTTSTAPKAVLVKKVIERISSGERAMLVEFEPAGLPSFDMTHTKVYARDFDLLVKEGDVFSEAHRHLSLIDHNRRDYITDRLGASSGASRLIMASESTGTNGAVIVNAPFANLAGADDGLTGTPAFGDNDIIGSELTFTGLHALDTVKDISILVIPNASNAVAKAAIAYCEKRKDIFFVMDLPGDLSDPASYVSDKASSYAAIYYPWIVADDPISGKPITLPPSGAVAGIYAQTDVSRGVHKAPAGIGNGYLKSANGIQRVITKAENDILYQKKINVIRKYPEGILVWGTRTLSAEPAWRYVNVRRLFIFLEQSIERGLQWVVFEPNDFSLWKSIKRNVSAFLRVQWEEGKLAGATEDKAFFVRCDDVTNTPDTINAGQVIAEIGVAPSKPAEFVVFRFKQFVGKTQ